MASKIFEATFMLGMKYDATPSPAPKSPATSGRNLLNFSLGNADFKISITKNTIPEITGKYNVCISRLKKIYANMPIFFTGNAKKHKMETNLCQKFNNFLRAILMQHLNLLSKTP